MALRIARRARTDYAFFLALGLALLISGELLLISGGILDLFPLSGVATPFLSYGRTAMLANFLHRRHPAGARRASKGDTATHASTFTPA